MKVIPVLVLGGLVVAGCSPSYFEQGDSTRALVLASVNSGLVLESDLRQSTNLCPDAVPVRVENHAKNPNAPTAGFRDDIVVERYEVRYFRSDGRGVEGVDVPYSISGNVAAQVQGEGATTFSIEVVRRQAKLEPPLSQIVSGGGPFIITMFAELTLHARTTTGVTTNSAQGRLQITFADFANEPDDTQCPTADGQ
jgi:hypothetical protein